MAAPTKKDNGPNLAALGLRSPMEVIDILAMVKIGETRVVTDDSAALNPQLKADLVVKFFREKMGIKPSLLPYMASIIKQKLKSGQLAFGA